MSGNTRGKLKEHFEGIHRNFDWSMHHIQESLSLMAGQLSFSDDYLAAGDDKDKQQAVLKTYPLYSGVYELGQAIQQLDQLASEVYAKL